jgi:hypothetical protein
MVPKDNKAIIHMYVDTIWNQQQLDRADEFVAPAARSAIAVNERAPASTAHTASPKITASRWRTPRRCRRSATLASTASRPGESSASSARPAAIERGLVGQKQQLRSRSAYPVAEVRDVRLRDGRQVCVRPTRTSDSGAMQELFHRLPEDDVESRCRS